MELVRLDEIIEFSLGKNVTRIKEQDTEIFTPEDFERDLSSGDNECNTYGCIINLIKSKAAPISVHTESKVITQNFLKCLLDESKILPWYFCYQFNEGKELEQQIAMFHQGTTLSVKKLNVKTIYSNFIQLNFFFYRTMIPERFIWLVFSQLVLALHECHYGSKADGTQRPAILHR